MMVGRPFWKCNFLRYRQCVPRMTTTTTGATTTITRTEQLCVRRRSSQTPYGGDVHSFLDDVDDGNKIPHMGHGVRIGQYAWIQRTYTHQDIEQFGALIQDFNPLHSPQVFVLHEKDDNDDDDDDDDLVGDCISTTVIGKSHVEAGLIRTIVDHHGGRTTATSKPVVHGMLISSIFSSIFATLAPGCVYMNQTLDFVVPVHAGDTITGLVQIERIRKWRKGGVVVQCRTEALKEDVVVVGGGGSTEKLLEGKNDGNNRRVVAVKGNANVWLPNGYETLKGE